jgi:hypothetical protein
VQVKDLIDEANYYDSIKKYKLADKLNEKLMKIARDASWNDLDKGSGAGKAIQTIFGIETFKKFIEMNPFCSCLNEKGAGPMFMQSAADAALSGEEAKQKLIDQSSQLDTSCPPEILKKCMSLLAGEKPISNPMEEAGAQQARNQLNS